MNRSNSRISLLAAGCLVLVAGTALAQQPGVRSTPKPAPTQDAIPVTGRPVQPQPAPIVLDEPVITLDFRGGTVREYVDALRAASIGKPVNVVVSSAAEAVKLAPIQLNSVMLSDAVEAIQTAAGSRVGMWTIGRVSGGRGQLPEGVVPTYGVDYMPVPVNNHLQHENATPSVAVFSLSDLVSPVSQGGAGLNGQMVLTAVEGAAEMATVDPIGPAVIRFHQDSSLLIVRGVENQREAVRAVVQQLMQDTGSRRAREVQGMPTDAELINLRAGVDLSRSRHSASMQRARQASEDAGRAEQRAAGGLMSEGEFAHAKSMAMDAMTQVNEAEVELKRAQALFELAQSRQSKDGVDVVYKLPNCDESVYSQVFSISQMLAGSWGAQVESAEVDGNAKALKVTAPASKHEVYHVILKEICRARGLAEPEASPRESGQDSGK